MIDPKQIKTGECVFSPDRVYRYSLWRKFGPTRNRPPGSFLVVIGLNPSKADENRNDMTIMRCIHFAHAWGFGSMCMLNLFAYRATDPLDMRQQRSPIGPDNDYHINNITQRCVINGGIVLAAWGNHAIHMGRGERVRARMAKSGIPLHMLGLTNERRPKHPMGRGTHRIPDDAQPKLWTFE